MRSLLTAAEWAQLRAEVRAELEDEIRAEVEAEQEKRAAEAASISLTRRILGDSPRRNR